MDNIKVENDKKNLFCPKLEAELKSLPIWGGLDDLMIKGRLLNKEAQDFDENLRKLHRNIDTELVPFNSRSSEETIVESPYIIKGDSVYISLPAEATYRYCQTYRRTLRVSPSVDSSFAALTIDSNKKKDVTIKKECSNTQAEEEEEDSDSSVRLIDPSDKDIELVRQQKQKIAELKICTGGDDDFIEIMRRQLEMKEIVYVCANRTKAWVKGEVLQMFKRSKVTFIRVRVLDSTGKDSVTESKIVDVNKNYLARLIEINEYPVFPTKRVIAGYGPCTMTPGIVAECPSTFNLERYLIFHDNGKVAYYKPDQIYPILGQSLAPWRDAINHNPVQLFEQLRYFFARWPKRNLYNAKLGSMVPIKIDESVRSGRCIEIDCSLMRLEYDDLNYEESVYRGSPRLCSLSNSNTENNNFETVDFEALKLLGNDTTTCKFNEKLQNFMEKYHYVSNLTLNEGNIEDFMIDVARSQRKMRRSRNIAVKSATLANHYGNRRRPEESNARIHVKLTDESLIYETEDKELLDVESNIATHKCDGDCLKSSLESQIEDFDVKYRNESCLRIPHFLGWRRILTRTKSTRRQSKEVIVYKAPCGRVFRGLYDITRYIDQTGSRLDIDYFCFDPSIKLTARDTPDMWARQYDPDIAISRDKETGEITYLEKKPVSLVNSVSDERLPEDFEYRANRFPHPELAAQGFTFNEEFRSCCDCEGNCADRIDCACQRLTEEGQKEGRILQYKYKRLEKLIQTGIFECNDDCSCNYQCPNRVVQNGMKFRLQVFRTLKKGWGVRTLDDIPKGAFVCTYSAEILDDADNYGDSDMYYADLDYITVNEQHKEGLSSDEDDPIDPGDSGSVSNQESFKNPSSCGDYDDDDDLGNYGSDDLDDNYDDYEAKSKEHSRAGRSVASAATSLIVNTGRRGAKIDNVKAGKRPAKSPDSGSISSWASISQRNRSDCCNNKDGDDDNYEQADEFEVHGDQYVPKRPEKLQPTSSSSSDSYATAVGGSFSAAAAAAVESASIGARKPLQHEQDDADSQESQSRYPKRSHTRQSKSAGYYFKNAPAPAFATTTENGKKSRGNESLKNSGPQYKKIHDILGSKNYTLDARMQGNVGRFFNHSHGPNLFAQNVFIDTHDLRFPWVAFFACDNIRAMDELTWNYHYLVDSIPGRAMECHCGAKDCNGRIL